MSGGKGCGDEGRKVDGETVKVEKDAEEASITQNTEKEEEKKKLGGG